MSEDTDEALPFDLPNDFDARAKAMRHRLVGGEAMTLQYMADALGVPFEFIAACIGLMLALKTGEPVVIDPAQFPKLN